MTCRRCNVDPQGLVGQRNQHLCFSDWIAIAGDILHHGLEGSPLRTA